MVSTNESEICKASDWGPWGDCTETCGGGVQFSIRYPLTEGYNEFECGELSRSRECNTTPCPISIEVEFKYIDYKNATFNGWTDQELESGCDGSQNILRVSDTITLNYSADLALEVGTELEIPANNKLHEYFSVSANGEWVYANDMFLKLKNRQVVDLRECEIFSDPTPDSVATWCGVEFTTDSFICVGGVSDVGGTFDNSVSDRYYYSQETDSLKTEWTSHNNLLSILYLPSTDSRNSLMGSNVWAVFNKQTNTILYYTVDFDETQPCPPMKSEWIPVHPQTSHTLSLATECDGASDGEFSCDLKDGYVSGWFEFSDETMFVNSLEKNNAPHDDSVNTSCDFGGILTRGSGFPTNEENVFAQISRGHFNISKLSTNPPAVGVSRYFTSDESGGGDVEHKIEIPLNRVVDLVNLKIMSVMSQPGNFDIQVYSIKEQSWVHLDTVNHFTKTQQIVTDVKNDFYDAANPPLDASDALVESVVAIRIYVGNYDYENNTSAPTTIANNLQGLLLHSIRVEGRVETKCSPNEVAYITNRDIKQITPYVADESPRFYRNATEIVGNGCVGDLLYGNYRYEGRVDAIGYAWYLNNVLTANTRHIHTDEYTSGDELKFSVTFTHSNGKVDVFSSSLTLSNCKLELFPVNDNSADFLYVSKSHDNDLEFVTGFPTATDACTTTETNKITFHWKGNLEVGEQLSTEKEFATTEKVTSGHQYFVHRGDNYVIKLNSDVQVAEIISCSPAKFDLELSNKFAIDYQSVTGTSVGTLVGSPNTDIKYFLNTTTFGIHNDLFRLEGLDPVNNIQNMNLVLNGDISEIGTEAKISVLATSRDDIGELEKNFTINIHKDELDRFADCVRLTLGGFDADIINGNYGLIFEDTSQQTGVSGYQTHNQKLVFRTNRRYTDGFLLMDGTVELGAGHIYSQIRYSSEKTRWEIYVYSDDTPGDTNFNDSLREGKLCAFSAQTQLNCPVGMGFSGISPSYGLGITIGNGEVSFGSDYISDCSEFGMC